MLIEQQSPQSVQWSKWASLGTPASQAKLCWLPRQIPTSQELVSHSVPVASSLLSHSRVFLCLK